ncbi:hypothetical protein SESBI_27061 [Sesbania bispinosa]|nr:hypothetical protein SESBI_27061 [Sesbania bispinosa]
MNNKEKEIAKIGCVIGVCALDLKVQVEDGNILQISGECEGEGEGGQKRQVVPRGEAVRQLHAAVPVTGGCQCGTDCVHSEEWVADVTVTKLETETESRNERQIDVA